MVDPVQRSTPSRQTSRRSSSPAQTSRPSAARCSPTPEPRPGASPKRRRNPMTEKPKLEVVENTPSPTPNDALDIEALWLDPALGDGLTDTSWHTIPVDKPKDFFRVHPDPRLPAPYRNLRPQDRRPDRNGVLHSGAGDAGAVAGSPTLRSRHLHLSRRLAAAVADDVSARGRKGQHGLVDRPGRGADCDRQMGAPGLEQGARI